MPVVNETVATPLAFVVLVGESNEPPLPVLLQVTVLPAVGTGLLLASANCAVIVTAVPATGLLLLDVTRYFVAVPASVNVALVTAEPALHPPPLQTLTVHVPAGLAPVVGKVSVTVKGAVEVALDVDCTEFQKDFSSR